MTQTIFTPTEARGLDLLREVMDHIEHLSADQSEAWDQGDWGHIAPDTISPADYTDAGPVWIGGTDRYVRIAPSSLVRLAEENTCGTAMCFAGWTSALVGDSPMVLHRDLKEHSHLVSWTNVQPVGTKDQVNVRDRAVHLLRITEMEADALFCGSNTIEILRQHVSDLLDGRSIAHIHPDED